MCSCVVSNPPDLYVPAATPCPEQLPEKRTCSRHFRILNRHLPAQHIHTNSTMMIRAILATSLLLLACQQAHGTGSAPMRCVHPPTVRPSTAQTQRCPTIDNNYNCGAYQALEVFYYNVNNGAWVLGQGKTAHRCPPSPTLLRRVPGQSSL